VVGDRDPDSGHRRQPGREGPGVVLEQHREEPLDRPEQGPVDHHRLLAGAVGGLYSRSKRCGIWKSTWIVDICQVRPMASLACTLIFGP
jgi:hypothetical protein